MPAPGLATTPPTTLVLRFSDEEEGQTTTAPGTPFMPEIHTPKVFRQHMSNKNNNAISQIKTVYAFVGESSATKSFIENMEKQYVISKGEALVKGVGIGM
ncbi:hypothetical protein JHK87_006537 [Glycine soja]|nr:hypothetical protein JHK87_006537 [Glycine soja]